MQKVKKVIPGVFLISFDKIEHKYPTRFSKCNFKQPPAFINYVTFLISSQRSKLLSKILSETEKNISNLLIFKAQIKEKPVLLTMS